MTGRLHVIRLLAAALLLAFAAPSMACCPHGGATVQPDVHAIHTNAGHAAPDTPAKPHPMKTACAMVCCLAAAGLDVLAAPNEAALERRSVMAVTAAAIDADPISPPPRRA